MPTNIVSSTLNDVLLLLDISYAFRKIFHPSGSLSVAPL